VDVSFGRADGFADVAAAGTAALRVLRANFFHIAVYRRERAVSIGSGNLKST